MNSSKAPVPWSTGLWDCCDDGSNCCLTCICPSITFGRIAEIIDKGEPSSCKSGRIYALINLIFHCGRLYSCGYRSKLRQQYGLSEGPCGDFIVHLLCEPFALCQEYRELKNRGFDMSIGWQGNVEKQQVELTKAPVAEEGMAR